MNSRERLYELSETNPTLRYAWLFCDREFNPHFYESRTGEEASSIHNESEISSTIGSRKDGFSESILEGECSIRQEPEDSFNLDYVQAQETQMLDESTAALTSSMQRLRVSPVIFNRPQFSTSHISQSRFQQSHGRQGSSHEFGRSQSQAANPQSSASMNQEFEPEDQLQNPNQEALSYDEALALLYKFASKLKSRFKEDYPFAVEGIVLRDSSSHHGERQVFVYSGRIGRFKLEDHPSRGNNDYVWVLAERPNVFNGQEFGHRPPDLISTKFVTNSGVEIRGYAVLGFGRSDGSEGHWVAWSDSVGLMHVIPNSARLLKRKFTSYDPTLNVVKYIACFENNRFAVKKLDHITNVEERAKQFPELVFLVKNCIISNKLTTDHVFRSRHFEYPIIVRQNQIGITIEKSLEYDIVVCATFPTFTRVEFRGLAVFLPSEWFQSKEWMDIKIRLESNTEKIFGGNNQNYSDTTTFENFGNRVE